MLIAVLVIVAVLVALALLIALSDRLTSSVIHRRVRGQAIDPLAVAQWREQ